jgi:hypothetical protein
MALISSLEASYKTVAPKNKENPNKEHLDWYFTNEEGLTAIRLIVESIYTNILSYHSERFTDGNERLHTLRTELMDSEIQAMKDKLAKPKYQLDDIESVQAICGTRQLEQVGTEDARPCAFCC